MGGDAFRLIEQSDAYKRGCKLADDTAIQIHAWSFFSQRTVGVQLVTSLDSIAANLVEGDGRGPSPDCIRFWRYARASAREARNWFQRAMARGYFEESHCVASVKELTEIVLMIQGLIRHREGRASVVKEEMHRYNQDPTDVFAYFDHIYATFDNEYPPTP